MSNLDGAKILLVDDERFIRVTIRAAPRAVGRFDVAEADDGDTALVEAERCKPDVVLCDVTVPRVGGPRFVELSRRHADERVRGTPVIILTGHAEATTVVAASKPQINGYLIKPVSPKQLGDQSRKIFARRQAMPPA